MKRNSIDKLLVVQWDLPLLNVGQYLYVEVGKKIVHLQEASNEIYGR